MGCAPLHPTPGNPTPGPGFYYIEDSSGNRFVLNGIQELFATVFFYSVTELSRISELSQICNLIVSKTCNQNYPNLVTVLSWDRNVLLPISFDKRISYSLKGYRCKMYRNHFKVELHNNEILTSLYTSGS